MNLEGVFLEQGILGAIILILLSAIGLLFRINQAALKETRDIHGEMITRYETIIRTSISHQKELQATLEKLVEGVAAQELMTRFLDKIQK